MSYKRKRPSLVGGRFFCVPPERMVTEKFGKMVSTMLGLLHGGNRLEALAAMLQSGRVGIPDFTQIFGNAALHIKQLLPLIKIEHRFLTFAIQFDFSRQSLDS